MPIVQSPGACLEEEGVRRLCKYMKNAQETPLQVEIWDGNCVPQRSPRWGGEEGILLLFPGV